MACELMTIIFQKTAIIGLGLIGASIGQAMLDRKLTHAIVACDRCQDSLSIALDEGLIVEGFHDVNALLDAHGDVDLLVLAMPARAIADILPTLLKLKLDNRIASSAIIVDVASTKQNILQAIINACRYKQKPYDFLNFVPSHPIAGAEKSGVTARSGDLFVNHQFIICQDERMTASVDAFDKIQKLWQGIGANVSMMSPQKHDEILSLTSHLPHLLSYALTYQLAKDDENLNIFRYAAGGFRDFSRISASSPIMWHDIFLANKEAVLKGLDTYQAILNELKTAILNDNSDELLTTFETAKNAREYFGRLLVEKEKLKNGL